MLRRVGLKKLTCRYYLSAVNYVYTSEEKMVEEYALGTQVRFQPTVDQGGIYIGTQDGQVICIDTKDKDLSGWPMWGGNAAHTGMAQ